MLLLRIIGLYYSYIKYKFLYRKYVSFLGFTPIYCFSNSNIEFGGGGKKIRIYSSPFSNMVGLYQRSIIIARYGGKIKLEAGVCMSGTTIYSMNCISIGKDTVIGGNTKIIDNDFHPLQASERVEHRIENVKKKPITIGNGCFIGANVIILKGTVIGNNCVVGAGSVVSGVFPDNVIIAGNPAKVIKNNARNYDNI